MKRKTSERQQELAAVMQKYIHAYIHTYIHAYIQTYIHAYIHTYLHMRGKAKNQHLLRSPEWSIAIATSNHEETWD